MNKYARRMLMMDNKMDRGELYDSERYIMRSGEDYGYKRNMDRRYLKEDYRNDYRMGYSDDYDMRRDMRDSKRDYREEDRVHFNKRDMEKWKKQMENEDGTRGEHFRSEQCESVTRSYGKGFDPDVFCLAMNMMYSDYCGVAKKYGIDRIEFYAELAKAFLKDKDFDGDPEEKLYIYYKAIVEDDE